MSIEQWSQISQYLWQRGFGPTAQGSIRLVGERWQGWLTGKLLDYGPMTQPPDSKGRFDSKEEAAEAIEQVAPKVRWRDDLGTWRCDFGLGVQATVELVDDDWCASVHCSTRVFPGVRNCEWQPEHAKRDGHYSRFETAQAAMSAVESMIPKVTEIEIKFARPSPTPRCPYCNRT